MAFKGFGVFLGGLACGWGDPGCVGCLGRRGRVRWGWAGLCDICFCVFFGCYCPDWALGWGSTRI